MVDVDGLNAFGAHIRKYFGHAMLNVVNYFVAVLALTEIALHIV